jgi:hypothetical protein
MEQSTTGLSTETPTKPTCLHCGKLGHWEDKCWSKNPDQKKAYIEKRYGKKTKKENKNNASTNEVNLPHSDLPIRVAGPSGTKPLATTGLNSDNKGTPPRTDPKKRHPRSPPNYRRSAAKDSKQELAFFGPTTKIS